MVTPWSTQQRQILEAYLLECLEQERQQLPVDSYWVKEVFTRLGSYIQGGKLIRGLLVGLASDSFSGETDEKWDSQALKVAAAVELFQAAMLIHDDLVDGDQLRRGQPSMHAQFQQLAETLGYHEASQVGENLALFVGDVTLALAQSVLATVETSLPQFQQLQRLFAAETAQVSLAQMLDVSQTARRSGVTEAEILELYRLKTGRYSIYLPLGLGAILGGQSAKLEVLEKFSQSLGILFQLKDDELGLCGSAAQTGKLSSSDVREGKKTLYYYYTTQLLQPSDLVIFTQLYGQLQINETQLEQVKQLIKKSGADQQVSNLMKTYAAEANRLIETLSLKTATRARWRGLVQLMTDRRQ